MTDEVALSTCTEQIDELIHQQRNDEAIALCKHVLRYYPKHIVTYRQMAEASLEKGDLNSALELFRRVLGADPESILAYAGLAIVFEQQHLIAEAAWQLERAYELNPADVEIRKELLRLYADVEGKPRTRLKLTPGGLARLYLQQGLLSQAIQELSALAPTSDGRYDVRVALMQALWQVGRPREAAESAQSLLELLPYCLKANLILGAVWSENGLEESATYLQRAQALDPTNQIAQDLLGTHSPLSPANPVLPKYVEGASEFGAAPAPPALVPMATPTAEPDWLSRLKASDQPTVETPVPVTTGEEWLAEKPLEPTTPLQLTSGEPLATEAVTGAAPEAPALEAAAQVALEAPLPADQTSSAAPVAEAPVPQAPSEFVVAETEPALTAPEKEAPPSEPGQPLAAAEQMPEWLRGETPTLPAPAEPVQEPPRVEMTRPAWLENLIHAQQEALENAPEEEPPSAAEPAEAADENATPSWLGPVETALPEEKPVTEEMPETPQWLKEILAAAEATRMRAQETPQPTEETRTRTEETSKPNEEIQPAAAAPPAEPVRAKAAPAESAQVKTTPSKPAQAETARAEAAPPKPAPAEPTVGPSAPIKPIPAEPAKPAPRAAPAHVEPAAGEPQDLPDWLKKLRAEFEADQASLQPEEPAPPKATPPVKAPPPVVAPPHVEAPSPAEVPAPAEPAARAITPAPIQPSRRVAPPPKAAEPSPAPLAEPKIERKVEPRPAEPEPAPPAPVPEEPDWLIHMREEFGGGPAVEPSPQPAAAVPEPPPAMAAPPPSEPPAPARPEPIASEPAAPALTAPAHEVPSIGREAPPAAAEQSEDTQSILVRREAVALIRLDQARSYRDKKRIGEALAEYDYIVQQAPQFVGDVIHDLEEMIQQPGAPLQAHRILGDAYTRANRLPEALQRYRYVLDRVS